MPNTFSYRQQLQCQLIERFGRRHNLAFNNAAMIWIPKRAAKYSAWFNRHVAI